MNWRIGFSRFLFRLATWMQSLPVFLMRPEDLIEFTRGSYSKPNFVESWSSPEFVDEGLNGNEISLLERIPIRTGQLLLLGVGGGREAITLARQGFKVTGVDFVPEMVAQAKANARRHHVEIEGLVQEISNLEVAPASFDVIWFSTALYSSIPTRDSRLSALQRMHRILRSGGCVVCQFSWNACAGHYSARTQGLGHLVALLTFGNCRFEDGDQLHAGLEFIHYFKSENELRSEFEAAGFSIHYLNVCEDLSMSGAILVKAQTCGVPADTPGN